MGYAGSHYGGVVTQDIVIALAIERSSSPHWLGYDCAFPNQRDGLTQLSYVVAVSWLDLNNKWSDPSATTLGCSMWVASLAGHRS